MKMHCWAILIGIVLALAATAGEQSATVDDSATEYTVHKGLVYSSLDEELKLDLFLPRKGTKPLPCVIVIQGGGFLSQDGHQFRPFASHLARNGFAAALIAYRGRPNHTFRTTIADVKAAVRFVRKISGDYGIASDRIGAIGRSAGATLAALLAVTGGDEEFEGHSVHADFSSRIQTAVGIAGVYDFVARFTKEEQTSIQPRLEVKLGTNSEWIGAPFPASHKDWLSASAINHVDRTDPPMMFIHSKDDRTVPWMQSRDMHRAMRDVGIQSEIVLSGTGGHAGPPNTRELMVTFLRKVLVEQGAGSN